MENELPIIKITLIGDPCSGKSSIISRYIDDIYEENQPPTMGSNYSEKIVKRNGKEYEINIWDTTGQEKFNSIGKHLYKECYVVILLYNIESQESLEHLKTIWYPDLEKYGEKYTILAVVGHNINSKEGNNLADENYAKEFAKDIGASFYLVSAKRGEGIQELFDSLIDRFLSPEFAGKYEEIMKIKEKNGNSNQDGKNNKKKKKDNCLIF